MNLKMITNTISNRGALGGAPKRAFVHSMEGDIYLVELEQNGVSEFVEDSTAKQPKRFKSLVTAKEFAKKRGAGEVTVGVKAPYDEMIGLASIS